MDSMTGRKPDRYVHHWETVAVTALPPGWYNVYHDDGAHQSSPCPALLTQEHRETVECWDVQSDDGKIVRTRTVSLTAPYEVRVVFADHEAGSLYPVTEIGNYVETMGPGEGAPT
jgi:hypothetical protein